MVFITLINNIALLLALGITYGFIIRYWKFGQLSKQITSGFIYGLIAIVSMATPLTLAPGIVIDSRSILTSIAGLFGGPITAIIASIMASLCRWHTGGAGTIMGIGVVWTSAAWGVIFYYLRNYKHKNMTTPFNLFLLGFLVHITFLSWTPILPVTERNTLLSNVTIPLLTIFPVGTVLLGLILADQEAHISASKALKDSESRYRLLVENQYDLITKIDMDYRLLFVSPSYCKMFGKTENELLGQSFIPLIHEDNQEHVKKELAKINDNPQNSYQEVKQSTKDGWRWFGWINKPIYDNKGNITSIIAVGRDITARKNIEQERENLIKELELKNDELKTFTYTVSHDLKSPLITIKGFAGALINDIEANDKEHIESDIAHITNAADKMNTLLSELLDISRIGRMVNLPSNATINKIVENVLNVIPEELKENITINIQPNLPEITCDLARIEQVYLNLIQNAIKYMGDQPTPQIDIGVQKNNDQNVFFVRDNGIGIEEQYHEKIFALFEKLNHDSEGSGVGLAIVKRIIEAHQGQIWLESTSKKGTCFYFTVNLPAIPELT